MNVTWWYRRVGLAALGTLAIVSFVNAAPATLNPLVPRARQAGATPAECAESLAPAAEPRVSVRDIPLPEISPAAAVAEAPPSASLRTALQDAQTALARNDRPAFDEALASARSLMTTYPTGAERRAAEELVRTYETAARLWDAQFESPFFDEASPEFQMMSAYPGWAEAVRRGTITEPRTGRRFYPAAESRDFLSRVAADRLRGLGLQAPVRVARGDQAPRTPASTAVTPRRRTPTQTASPSTTTATTSRTRATTRRGSRRSTTRVAAATPGSNPRPSRPRLSSAPAHPRLSTESRTAAAISTPPGSPATSASSGAGTAAALDPASPAAASPGSATTPPAAGGSPPAGATDTALRDVPDATTTPATPATDTSVTTPPAGIEPVPAPVPPSRSRSVILPAILILIGLGVLIVLFRASK